MLCVLMVEGMSAVVNDILSLMSVMSTPPACCCCLPRPGPSSSQSRFPLSK